MTKNYKMHFIICPERTGSSYLRRLLNCHPGLACPPENVWMKRMFNAPVAKHLWKSEFGSIDKFYSELFQTFRIFGDSFRNMICKYTGKGIYVVKQVGFVEHNYVVNRVIRVFSDSQFLFWSRHPYDTVLSQISRWNNNNFPEVEKRISLFRNNNDIDRFEAEVMTSRAFWRNWFGGMEKTKNKMITRFENLRYQDGSINWDLFGDIVEFFSGFKDGIDETKRKYTNDEHLKKRPTRTNKRWKNLNKNRKNIIRKYLKPVVKKLGYNGY